MHANMKIKSVYYFAYLNIFVSCSCCQCIRHIHQEVVVYFSPHIPRAELMERFQMVRFVLLLYIFLNLQNPVWPEPRESERSVAWRKKQQQAQSMLTARRWITSAWVWLPTFHLSSNILFHPLLALFISLSLSIYIYFALLPYSSCPHSFSLSVFSSWLTKRLPSQQTRVVIVAVLSGRGKEITSGLLRSKPSWCPRKYFSHFMGSNATVTVVNCWLGLSKLL